MAVANGLGYALNLVASRLLGPTDFGALGALLGVVLIGNVAALGLQTVTARVLAGTPGSFGAEAARLYARPPRPHEVRGVVETGDRRGRELGFPTANVAVSARLCLPADGIYDGTYVTPDGVEHPTAISSPRTGSTVTT